MIQEIIQVFSITWIFSNFIWHVQSHYIHVHIFYRIVDNLPCATKFELMETGDIQYEHGYRLGFVKDNVVSCYQNYITYIL